MPVVDITNLQYTNNHENGGILFILFLYQQSQIMPKNKKLEMKRVGYICYVEPCVSNIPDHYQCSFTSTDRTHLMSQTKWREEYEEQLEFFQVLPLEKILILIPSLLTGLFQIVLPKYARDS